MPHIRPRLIKIRRKALKKTQKQVAESAGIALRQFQRYEKSKEESCEVRDDTLIGLAKALRVDRQVLTGEKEMPELSVHSRQPAGQTNHLVENPREENFTQTLVKDGAGFIITESSDLNPVGKIIARDIPDEASGLRLTSSYPMRKKLVECYNVLHAAQRIEEDFTEMEFYEFLDSIHSLL